MVVRSVRVPKGAEIIAHQLRVQIVTGALREGDSLPTEAELMASLGVSRPTLREAIRVLESERLVEIRRGVHGGGRIRRPDAGAVARSLALLLGHRDVGLTDVYQAEAILEDFAVRSLAERAKAHDVHALRKALEASADTTKGDEARVVALRNFHREVMERAGNATIGILSDTIRRIIDTASENVLDVRDRADGPTDLDGAHRAHVQLVDAIESGDADKAVELWRKHLHLSSAHMLRLAKTHNVLDYLDL